MNGQCLVAVYPSRNEAEQALRAAVDAGIPSGNVRISRSDSEAQWPHVWDWLLSNRHVPERDKSYYRTHLAEGRTALSVLVDGGASQDRINAVEEILERFHPVDVHVEREGATAATPAARPAAAAGEPSVRTGRRAEARTGEEEVIPLPSEELRIGIRASDRVRHIKTYVVEEPVEKEVSLSDERLIVERRPATGAAGEIAERDYEFRERHEEPIVEKTTRADEELVVRKQADQHTERVRGTVRKTKAEVQKDPSTPPPAAMKGRS